MYTFDLPTTPAARKMFFNTMMPVNQRLIVDLYRTEDKFLTSDTRHNPLETWILRYDRAMGFTPDVLTLSNEIGVTSTGDIRVDLYGHLAYLVRNRKAK